MDGSTLQTAKALIRFLHPDSAVSLQRSRKTKTADRMMQIGNVLEQGAASGAVRGQDEKVISVQYNPSSLHISQQISEQADNAGDGLDMAVNVAGNCTRTLEVELVFAGREKETPDIVKKRVEMFLALMMHSPDRRISFSWGELECTGFVSSMSASYDMFDRTGAPLAGSVKLTIREDAEDVGRAFEKAD